MDTSSLIAVQGAPDRPASIATAVPFDEILLPQCLEPKAPFTHPFKTRRNTQLVMLWEWKIVPGCASCIQVESVTSFWLDMDDPGACQDRAADSCISGQPFSHQETLAPSLRCFALFDCDSGRSLTA